MSESHSHTHDGGSDTHRHDFSASNKAYFDGIAHEYDERPDAQELSRRLVPVMRKKYPTLFDEDSTVLMDYACGTGLLSRALCPYVKSIVGVDISSGMVDYFNLRASNQGLTSDEMRAMCVELKGIEQELNGQKFDVIVCSMAYHHMSSIEDTTRILSFFLKPGGSLLVVDIVKASLETEIAPGHDHLVAHQHGFDVEEMRTVFIGAGLSDFEYSVAASAKVHGQPLEIFLARGIMQ